MKNKRILLILGLLVVLAIGATTVVRLGEPLMTNQLPWVVVETCTSDGNEPSDLAVTERTYLTVKAAIVAAGGDTGTGVGSEGDAEIQIFPIPPWWNGGIFECIGISNNNSVTHQIYLGTLGDDSDCELVKVGQLAWTIGTQVSTVSTYELADTLTVTGYCWTSSWSSTSPTGELVAMASLDFKGSDIMVIVTTTSACDSKLKVKGF